MVTNFDLFDSGDQLQRIFHLDDSDNYPPYNAYFDYLGYDSSNFLYSI